MKKTTCPKCGRIVPIRNVQVVKWMHQAGTRPMCKECRAKVAQGVKRDG